MLAALARRRQTGGVRLLSIVPSHDDLRPTALDPAAVLEALNSYSNDWTKALDFFTWARSQQPNSTTTTTTTNTDTYNKMIDILGKYFEFDLAWSLVREMPQPDHATCRTLFKRYASAHLVEEAVNTFECRIGEFGLKDDRSFCNLVDALCEYRHVVEAEGLVFGEKVDDRSFRKYPTKVYNMILRGWFKIGWWGKCREFWEEMDRRGVEKDLHSYSIYMDICCKGGKPWRAVKVYKEMKRRGMTLDVVAYNTVVRAVGLSQGVDFALRVLREMREVRCEPNVVSYNCVIGLLCENGRVKEGYKVMDEMRRRGVKPDVMTYHCFFGCLELPREVLLLFDRMVKDGVRPRVDTFVMLMKKFGRWGFLRPVLLVWKRMEELGCCPDEFAYNALIDALIDKGMLDLAQMYEQEMLEKGLSAKPRKELATKLVEAELVNGPKNSRW